MGRKIQISMDEYEIKIFSRKINFYGRIWNQDVEFVTLMYDNWSQYHLMKELEEWIWKVTWVQNENQTQSHLGLKAITLLQSLICPFVCVKYVGNWH